MAIELVLDCDGVLTDIGTPAQRVLHTLSDDELMPYVSKYTSLESLRNFAQNFDFERDTNDFELTTISVAQKELICSLWRRVFATPEPLQDYTGGISQDWLIYRLGSPTGKYTSWQEIGEWLNRLSDKCDITIHTHIDSESAPIRQEWFDKNIFPHIKNKSKINLFLDTGTIKQQLQGDIVVEDRLLNCLTSKADLKILRGQFHNLSSSLYNQDVWAEFISTPPKKHKIYPVCVSSFPDMTKVIDEYIEKRLTQ